MELYGSYTSPFVRHCRIALKETGLDCEFIEADAAVSAEKSPTKKVPFLIDESTLLSDSTSILRYMREQAGQSFLPTCNDLDLYCLINTGLDTTVNLFLMERGGLDINATPYLLRHQNRITTTLDCLNNIELGHVKPNNDVHWRLACFLAWGTFRNRINLDQYPTLQSFLESAQANQDFQETTPPNAP